MSRDLVISTNIAAMEAQRCMQKSSSAITVAQRELGSGSRVADPAHDPSSTSIGLVFSSNINTLMQGSKNCAQAGSMVQMYLSILTETSSILSRVSTLATQANTDVMSDDTRKMIDLEFQDLLNQIARNSEIAWQNGEKLLLDGKTLYVQIDQGMSGSDLLCLNFKSATLDALGLAGLKIDTILGAQQAESAVTPAITNISDWIADLGALRNQMEYTIETNNITVQGMSGAKSTFVDADIAESLMAIQSNQALFDMSTAAFQRSAKRASQLAEIVQRTLA
jgi:flagellin